MRDRIALAAELASRRRAAERNKQPETHKEQHRLLRRELLLSLWLTLAAFAVILVALWRAMR